MSRRTYTPAERQRDKETRDAMQELTARIEALAVRLKLDEMSAVMAACGTIRCASHGYVMRLVKTDDGTDARKAVDL